MVVGIHPLEGLRDVRNPARARLQNRGDTCGLHVAVSVLGDVNPGGVSVDLSGVLEWIRTNRVAGRIGLNSFELTILLNRNLPDDAAVLIERGVTEDRLLDLLGRGHVISHVDGDHWVRVLGRVEDDGSTWVRLHDPARGRYEQLLSGFIMRTGRDNQMIWVRP